MGDEVRIVTSGLGFPEGPVVLPDGDVLVVEVRRGRLTRVHPDGSTTIVAEVGGGPNGAAIGPDGDVYVVNNGGFSWSEIHGMILPIDETGSNRPPDFTGGWVDRVDLEPRARSPGCSTTSTASRSSAPTTSCSTPPAASGSPTSARWGPATWTGAASTGRAPTAPTSAASPRASPAPTASASPPTAPPLYAAETHTGRLLAWDVTGPGEVAGPHRIVVSTPTHFDSLAVEADGTVVIAAISDGLCAVRPDGSRRVHRRCPTS